MNSLARIGDKPPAPTIAPRFPQPMEQTLPTAAELLTRGKYYDAIIADRRRTYFGSEISVNALTAALEALGIDRTNPLAKIVIGQNGSKIIDHSQLSADEQALHTISAFGDELKKLGFSDYICVVLLIAVRARRKELNGKDEW